MSSIPPSFRTDDWVSQRQWRAVDEWGQTMRNMGRAGERVLNSAAQVQDMRIRQAESDARLQAFEAQRALNMRKLQEVQAIDATEVSYLQTERMRMENELLSEELRRTREGTEHRETMQEIQSRNMRYLMENPEAAWSNGFVVGPDGLRPAQKEEIEAQRREYASRGPSQPSQARDVNAWLGIAEEMGRAAQAPFGVEETPEQAKVREEMQAKRLDILRGLYQRFREGPRTGAGDIFSGAGGSARIDQAAASFIERYGTDYGSMMYGFARQWVNAEGDPIAAFNQRLNEVLQRSVAQKPDDMSDQDWADFVLIRVVEAIGRYREMVASEDPASYDLGPYLDLLLYLTNGER